MISYLFMLFVSLSIDNVFCCYFGRYVLGIINVLDAIIETMD